MMKTFFSSSLCDSKMIRKGLQQPYLVIENALKPEVAEELYQDLMASEAWQPHNTPHFSKTNQPLSKAIKSIDREVIALTSEESPNSVKRFYDCLLSEECLRWVSEASGRACNGFFGSSARYRKTGTHINRHNDFVRWKTENAEVTSSVVTFNFNLTKDWDPKWGGDFVWEKPPQRITPKFNSLTMFLIGPETQHQVEMVNNLATSPRLLLTGFFTQTRPLSQKLNINR